MKYEINARALIRTFTVFIFSSYGAKPTKKPFTLTKFSAMIELVLKYAKDLSFDLEARDNKGRTPLHYLFRSKPKKEVLQFLKLAKNEYNIDFDLKATDHKGKTPIEMSQS